MRPLDQAAVASLASEAARLARLVEDLHTLSLSDLGALTYHKEPVDLAEVIDDVLDAQRRAHRRARARSSRLQLDARRDACSPTRRGSRRSSRNLLQNSLRYTDAPGTIAVALRRDGRPRDRRLGRQRARACPRDELARLTERLYRVEGSRSRAGGGSGLGLAIARAIVEGHGGTLTARASALGGLGSRSRCRRIEERTAMADRILIVEDEEKLAGLLRDYLVQEGFEVVGAPPRRRGRGLGAHARRPTSSCSISCCPGKSGLDVCKALRAYDATSRSSW